MAEKMVVIVDTKTRKQYTVKEKEAKILLKNKAGRYGLVTGVEDIDVKEPTKIEEVGGDIDDAMPAKEVDEKMAEKPTAPKKRAPRRAKK